MCSYYIRNAAVAVLIALVVSFFGCGNDGATVPSEPGKPEEWSGIFEASGNEPVAGSDATAP